MFLKRLELNGFKSFADKTELEFVRGITAVVGPNGSGKSNISDSIRWVLGEQSAKSLRGGKMEDIIFAGSSERRPINFSEVTITLDNSDGALQLDFQEVVVTRRVSRTGDSEFFINKQPCRLKDIAELFMDTGIGKEAYSNIGQGRIEEILSTRSEDRRGIFEEASGIVKYKSRKKEAMKKLEDTEHNLLRIYDLTAELEKQLAPMSEQAAKATRFKELKSQLKHSEIALYVHNIENVHQTWTQSTKQLERLRDEQLVLSTQMSVKDAELAQQRAQLRQLEEELEQLQQQLLSVSEEYEKSEGQHEVLKERKKNVQQNMLQFEISKKAHAQRVAELQTEHASLVVQIVEKAAEVSTLMEQIVDVDAQISSVALLSTAEQNEVLKHTLRDRFTQISQVRNDVRYAVAQADVFQATLAKLAEQQTELSLTEQHYRTLQENDVEHYAQLQQQLQEAMHNDQTAKQHLQTVQQSVERATKLLREAEQRLESMRARRDTMQEMQDDFEGFVHGVREVLKAAKRSHQPLTGIHGAVAELIRVPEQLEQAMEVALGGAMQQIVVQNESSAREAISFLRDRQLGRATFLPLDVIRPRSISAQEQQQIAHVSGYVGIAASQIQCEAQYRGIVEHLLGNVIVADTLESANAIARTLNYRYRIVTLRGDVVNAGGSMTGGSQHKKSANLLGRKRQIEQLGEQLLQAEHDVQQCQADVSQRLEQQHHHQQVVDEWRLTGEQLRLQEQQLLADQRQHSNEMTRILQERTKLEAEAESCTQTIAQWQRSHDEAQQQLAVLEQEEQQLQAQLDDEELRRKNNEVEKEQLQTHLTELKVTNAKLVGEHTALCDQAERLLAEIHRTTQDIAHTDEAQRRQQVEEQQIVAETAQIQLKLDDLVQQKQTCAEQLDFKRAKRAEYSQSFTQGEQVTRDQRSDLRKVDEQLQQYEIQVNRLDVELDNLLRKLSEEYELSYEFAKANYAPGENIVTLQHEVRDLKRQMLSLGEVNVGAIEEYARLKERYDFLAGQQNDLIQAKTTLYDVIREMDEEMARRFTETFALIREHFNNVFAKLFGGGRADLILVTPDNVLESGIEIIAQPPGKKLQNLQLLSGGERALTAIALLFSILHVKPVPFCVLDEVEAALDEANVTRFAQYLRDFSSQTQFIVVTHRKGTMEEADVLYGVTMEEGGVSKLVSVRLEEETEIMA